MHDRVLLLNDWRTGGDGVDLRLTPAGGLVSVADGTDGRCGCDFEGQPTLLLGQDVGVQDVPRTVVAVVAVDAMAGTELGYDRVEVFQKTSLAQIHEPQTAIKSELPVCEKQSVLDGGDRIETDGCVLVVGLDEGVAAVADVAFGIDVVFALVPVGGAHAKQATVRGMDPC